MPHRSIAVFAAMVSVAAVGFGPAMCEAETLPKPTGPHSVGRITVHFVDSSREDDRGTHKDQKREFMAHVWYPAEFGTEGKPAPWMPPEWARLEEKGILGMRLRHSSDPAAKDVGKALASVVVHAREDVPLAASPKPFPVLLFACGSLMFPSEYSSLVEDLASRGFVVIGNVPTGYVAAVSFPDGNVTTSAGKPSARKPANGKPDLSRFSLWTGDVKYMLDQLEVWNTTRGHRFFGRLDLDRVGTFGHSAGGGAVAEFAAADQRVKAVALLDPGDPRGLRPQDARPIPTLVFKTERPAFVRRFPSAAESPEWDAFARKGKPGFLVKLLGAEHISVTDMAVLKCFALPGDGQAFIDTSRAIIGEFFAQSLLGKHSELLEKGSAKYPLAKFETPH